MRQNLMEAYGKQLKVAEAYVAKNYEGKRVSDNTKLTTAVLLDNTNRYMTESVTIGGTGRSDLGEWKKFCLNLTNIAVPSLIANDLVIVHPMTSFSGSVAYLKYVATSNKGGIKFGDEFNSVFGARAEISEDRINYTSQAVVEVVDGEAAAYFEYQPMWTPALDVKKVRVIHSDASFTDYEVVRVDDAETSTVAAGKVNYNVSPDAKTIGFKFPSALVATDKINLGYRYNQEVTPANEIPSIGPKMERIALVAEPRRIAVKYDQITAFQA